MGFSWVKAASEGETVTVPPESTIRYGVTATEQYFERTWTGPITASYEVFGDPAPGQTKSLWLWTESATEPTPAPPAPTPPPVPVPPPPPQDPNMPITLTIPSHPGAEPAADATWQVWDIYLRRLAQHLQAQQAQVKHEDEVACIEAQDRMRTAVHEQGKFTEFIFPKKTREELIFELMKTYPQNTRATELQIAKNCEMQVNAYLEVCPSALAAPVVTG